MILRICVLLLCFLPLRLWAQDAPPIGLFADHITYDQNTGEVVFTGNVTVLRDGAVLRADRIVYDEDTETLTLSEGFVLQGKDGNILSGAGGTLSRDFKTILVTGARSIAEHGLQLAAAQLERNPEGGTQLRRAVASSCTICDQGDAPVWQFRARHIRHDAEAGQYHYQDAYFDLYGITLFYFPYFRHADPNAGRLSGLLVPSFSSSDVIGVGAKIPYYYVIDDHSDVTLTPFVTSNEGVLLEAEYRKLFEDADLFVEGSLKVHPLDNMRGYVSADYVETLPSETVFTADVNWVSDKTFLEKFDYSSASRLASELRLHRFESDRFWDVSTVHTRSLRDGENSGTVPMVLPEFSYDRRWALHQNARAGFALSGASLIRQDGRDVMRATAKGMWEQTTFMTSGLVARGFGEAALDLYHVADDPNFTRESIARMRPTIGGELRFPLVRRSDSSDVIIEPMAQVILSGTDGGNDLVPNEDSLQVDFDGTNLFSISRFTGEDRFEPGLRANLGVRMERISDAGWSVVASLGQVLRAKATDSFGSSAGIGGTQSDYVSTVGFSNPADTLSGTARFLLDPDFVSNRSELVLNWSGEEGTAEFSYVFLKKNAIAGETEDRAEIAFDALHRLNPFWSGVVEQRFDLENSSPISSKIGFIHETECLRVETALKRQFTSSNDLDPHTQFAVSLSLVGIGSKRAGPAPARSCTPR